MARESNGQGPSFGLMTVRSPERGWFAPWKGAEPGKEGTQAISSGAHRLLGRGRGGGGMVAEDKMRKEDWVSGLESELRVFRNIL
jgi:hypothetical protein